jgi:hypothetical protein
MFRSVWHTESGKRSLIGVVLGQRGDNLVSAALYSAQQLVARLEPDAAAADLAGSAGGDERLGAGRPGLGPPGTYRPHIENRIRAGNTGVPSLAP